MTKEEKQAMIVNALVKSNLQGKLTWKPFEPVPGTVYTEVGGKMVYLSNVRNNELDSIQVEIYADGGLADKFVDDDLVDAQVASVSNDTWFLTLTGLLVSARRKSTGADEVLDSLLKDLEE
ncbi:hypothetical protein C8J46_105316 [Sphingomonas sp. PP-F2F-A104-K0414]|uniref:hypothetical protein n=1 Tax=Sphingomonas sp. PP-F2F-A104-K0414 TaxID=2135661 RepID=UPI00104B4C3D|nr:hypothetical protein [Sphingomonas sp. PP-F2F-A104-K0414]TCP98163.1 hypothetical protein C8J46_105316 [Sphingomonas sp. PP-F2F-A104-K0414]